MASISTIFGPNESQRCQLNFEKKLGCRKNFREGEKFKKVSRKVCKILPCTQFLGQNKIETFIKIPSQEFKVLDFPSENFVRNILAALIEMSYIKLLAACSAGLGAAKELPKSIQELT